MVLLKEQGKNSKTNLKRVHILKYYVGMKSKLTDMSFIIDLLNIV